MSRRPEILSRNQCNMEVGSFEEMSCFTNEKTCECVLINFVLSGGGECGLRTVHAVHEGFPIECELVLDSYGTLV